MDNIVENNKLIAEFMGYPKHKIDFVGKRLNFENSKHNTYHKDWNWLKLVLEKISYLNKDNFSDETKQALKDLLSLNLFSSKENVYESITNFIKTIS